MTPKNLKDRYQQIQEQIQRSAAKSKRTAREITLVAVTKNAPAQEVETLLELGHRDLGESKVQQLQSRLTQVQEYFRGPGAKGAAQPVRWHMIGHLQRNKVKPALQTCAYIHSVDSLRLAEEIQTASDKLARVISIFLEVNVTGENSKYGVAVGAALHLAEQIDTMDGVQLVGLMTMAPLSENPEDSRPAFCRLREIFEEIRFRKIGGNHFVHLSMGMSHDYGVAIEEGATMVRVGSALFGDVS